MKRPEYDGSIESIWVQKWVYPMWPFSKKPPEPVTSEELRARLIAAAASGSRRKLRKECQKYKSLVPQHLDALVRIPEEERTNNVVIDRYFRKLIAVAECLADECRAPELMNQLTGAPERNPFVRWQKWFESLPARMDRLEYDALVPEARALIEEAQKLRGHPVLRQKALLYGRLGELLFHSGRVAESLEPYQNALALCFEINDVEGQFAYLEWLIDAHRYLADGQAVVVAEQLVELKRRYGLPADDVEKRLKRLRQGEPLCRIVYELDEREVEMDDLTEFVPGRYQFLVHRDRPTLRKATTLTQQGKELATAARGSEALERFYAAGEVDPYDPDPIYQTGMCLLELGAYAKAKEAFEQVERMAPGWFQCRTDRWLAEGLETGSISVEQFRLLRVLEDGGLPPAQVEAIARYGIKQSPDFAPAYLALGISLREKAKADAIKAFRKGLELVEEPDLECRLLTSLAGLLDIDDPERPQLIERALKLAGGLTANAAARLMALEHRPKS